MQHSSVGSIPSAANLHTLLSKLSPDTPTFVLIDPIAGDPLPSTGEAGTQAARESMWQRPVIGIELASIVPLTRAQYPYLLALEGMNDPLLETTLDIALNERLESQAEGMEGSGTAVHRVGGWIQTRQSGRELAERLSFMLQLNTETPTNATYLRLADRRVLALVRHVVGEARLSSLLGHLQQWVYLDAQTKLEILKGSSVDDTELRFSKDEWVQIRQGEILNPALALWLGESIRVGQIQINTQPVQALYDALFQATESAQQAAKRWPHRFQQPIDQSIWAAMSLLYPALTSNKEVAQLLSSTGTKLEPAQPLRHIHHQLKACTNYGTPSQFATAT